MSLWATQSALMSSEHASSLLREARQPVDRRNHFFVFHVQLSSFQRSTYFGPCQNLNCVRQLFRRLLDSCEPVLFSFDRITDEFQFSP